MPKWLITGAIGGIIGGIISLFFGEINKINKKLDNLNRSVYEIKTQLNKGE